MEQNNKVQVLQLPPQSVTEPVITSFFNKELIKKEYPKVLQGMQNTKPNKNNLLDCQVKMKAGKKFLEDFEKFRKEITDPYFKVVKSVKGVSDNLMQPISLEVERLEKEIKVIDDQLSADLEAYNKEVARVANIKSVMDTFINNATMFITTAPTEKAIGSIQMRIGSEKSRTGFYQEFMDEFRSKCDALTPLINERKETIKKGNELIIQQADALKTGDEEKASELKEEIELMDIEMEENTLRLQEAAFEQVSSGEVYIGEPIIETAKGRNYWRWEVENIDKLYKKIPEFVLLSPNKEAIDKYMSVNKEAWEKEGRKEESVSGLKFFIKKYI